MVHRRLSLDATYIDYFQSVQASQRGLKNWFGIRVQNDGCLALIQIGDGQPNTFGKIYRIPVEVEILPGHIRMIIDDHLLNYPDSDLAEVLAGKKSFQEAIRTAGGE